MDNLIEKLERADGDSKELYEGICKALLPQLGASWGEKFLRMVYAGAFESAALTLVPEGVEWGCGSESETYDAEPFGGYHALVYFPAPRFKTIKAYASTPALAMCIATLKARGANPTTGDEL